VSTCDASDLLAIELRRAHESQLHAEVGGERRAYRRLVK
jgi:hypothetical protein